MLNDVHVPQDLLCPFCVFVLRAFLSVWDRQSAFRLGAPEVHRQAAGVLKMISDGQ